MLGICALASGGVGTVVAAGLLLQALSQELKVLAYSDGGLVISSFVDLGTCCEICSRIKGNNRMSTNRGRLQIQDWSHLNLHVIKVRGADEKARTGAGPGGGGAGGWNDIDPRSCTAKQPVEQHAQLTAGAVFSAGAMGRRHRATLTSMWVVRLSCAAAWPARIASRTMAST